jgi:cytochrome c oxidase assembly factor CtaG
MNTWDWEPSVVVGCAALAIGYLAIVRTRGLMRMPYFLAGVALLLLDLVSPIDALGDRYLFSAHIVQHFLLALVIPPLFLLGTPRWLAAAALERSVLNKLERALGQPPVSWLLGVGTMLAWHIPALFNAALANDGLHIFQHLGFLVTGTMFWWPILAPLEERRLPMLSAVSYLFSACVCCSLLGAFLTFGPIGLYPAYLNPPTHLWGLDPKSDQQLGGMLMWVPGCFVYLAGILSTVMRWYASPEAVREPLQSGTVDLS